MTQETWIGLGYYVLLLLSVALPISVLYLILRSTWERQFKRHNPLTSDLRRPAGYSLRSKLRTESENVVEGTIAMMVLAPFFLVNHIIQTYVMQDNGGLPRQLFFATLTGAGLFWAARKITRAGREYRRLSVALDGEIAVGQELDLLMLEGCHVFHDIPFRYGNIDHVVVSRSGVFAVNTKMRGKPSSGSRDAARMTVDYSEGVYRFPDGTHPISRGAADAESRWLAEHLTSSTGEPVQVEAIIAFPGWFIERTGQGRPLVINPKGATKFFVNSRSVYSDKQIQRIAHQLEQLVRDVSPSFGPEQERWEAK